MKKDNSGLQLQLLQLVYHRLHGRRQFLGLRRQRRSYTTILRKATAAGTAMPTMSCLLLKTAAEQIYQGE